jgi:hypothetical protein
MNDDELITILREALAEDTASGEDEEVSPRVTRDALSAFRWLRVNDELAELTFDSADVPSLSGVRGTHPPRQLRYRFDDMVIDCEVGEDALLGQLTPALPAAVEVWTPDGTSRALVVDELGRFVAEPVPTGPVIIRCTWAGRPPVVTPWLLV